MCIRDRLSSFKSYQAKRFRALLKVRPGVKRIVGLTGTPSSNAVSYTHLSFPNNHPARVAEGDLCHPYAAGKETL